jgi:hypothetical protein
MNIKKLRNNKGLTLVELLLALSLVGMVVTVIFGIFMIGIRAYGRGNTQTDIQYEVRRVTSNIVDELRHANGISTTTGSNTIDINNSNTKFYISDDYSKEMEYSLVSDKNILTVTLSAEQGALSYQQTTDIFLENEKTNDSTVAIPSTTSDIIYYNSPEPSNYDTEFGTFLNNDANLSSFTIAPVPDNWSSFTAISNIPQNFTFILPSGTTSVPIFSSITTNDSNANYIINNASNLSEVTEIVVTAEDTTTDKTYKYDFTVSGSVIGFTALATGDYMSIDGDLFQKISGNELLSVNSLSSKKWSDALSYSYSSSQSWISGNRILDKTDAETLDSLIETATYEWWTTTPDGVNKAYFIDSAGTTDSKNQNNSSGVRICIEIDTDVLEIGSGSGTKSDPFVPN